MELRYKVLEKTKATYIGNKEGKRGIKARYKKKESVDLEKTKATRRYKKN